MTTHASMDLSRWELRDFDPGAGSARDGEGWIPVAAPGDVYQALIAAGRLDHPFQGRGETEANCVRDREWWWRTTFETPPAAEDDRIELVFEGLDTFAAIYLDDEPLGRTDNMFRRWTFDIGAKVRPGTRHVLAIRFDPTTDHVAGATAPAWTAFTDRVSRSKRNLMRKAQFGWGWDWAPDLPTVGVWKPVRIETRPYPRISDVRFTTLTASIETAQVQVQIDAPSGLRLEISLRDPDGVPVFADTDAAASTLIEIQAPRLWWTADLGDQPLYALTVSLFDGDRRVDDIRRAVGLRTVALDQSPDPGEPGTTLFRFVLNDQPIFARGACWVPTTAFVGDVETEPYDRLIDQAVRANMNMIRVWGGGIYEPDRFYDLCDRKGLLVWQDFMFACAQYPENDAFVASVRAEVEDQVRRLRHHPCLALWCGNNESQAMHQINADLGGEPGPLSGLKLYDAVIPEVLSRLDPETPYWPGSPWGGANPNGMTAGDVHNWTVWHGLPPIPEDRMIGDYAVTQDGIAYTRYAEDHSKFVSEFGIQAAPAMGTLRRWLAPDDLTPDSPGFLARIKDEAHKADAMISTVTGPASTLQDYVDFTQWTQAEGLKFGIEHFRRRRPHCSGALLWQFNDCWPCVSWSLVDYDGIEKAAYQAVRRAFSPVMASFAEEDDGQIALWIVNDTSEIRKGRAVVSLDGFDGAAHWRETVTWSTPAHGSVVIWRGPVAQATDRVLTVRSSDDAFPPNRHFAVPIRQLALPAGARPAASIHRLGPDALRLALKADVYLAFVHLISDRPDLRFSDNHFDLAAGETQTITIIGSTAVGPDDIEVRCWNDRRSPLDKEVLS